MNAPLDEHDLWARTLALRLQALYGSPGDRAEELQRDLERRLRALAAGRSARRYSDVEPAAHGGMGTVARAFDAVLARPVALKSAARCHDAAEAARRRLRLLHEASVLASLQHPGIVMVLDVDVSANGEPFLVMPWLAGDNLHALLAAGRAEPEREPTLHRFVEVLARVCDAIAFAHAQGVVHRDLKPANIMVGAFGETCVIDWGLARRVDAPDVVSSESPGDAGGGDPRLTATGSVLGTPSYMPPERAAAGAREVVSPTADVYGIGAMLYELLTGSPPYSSERDDWTVADVLEAIRSRPPRTVRELAPEADPELASVCARAMQREATTRYRDVASLAADLRAHLEHRVVAAHGGGLATAARKWVRRNRTTALLLAGAATSLLVVGAWFVQRLASARAAADANLREVLDLAVVEQIADLRRRADDSLWPLSEAQAPALARWLDEAEALRPVQARLALRRDTESAGRSDDDGSQSERVWRRRQLDSAVAALQSFFAARPASPVLPLDSTVAAVRLRTEAAVALATRSLRTDAAVAAWSAVAARVAANPRYRGLSLTPQTGLLPLGCDPRSGLEEFAHLQTGDAPTRAADGALQFAADSGIVLVLLPGGKFFMGAAADDEHNRDPFAESVNEGPVHPVQLAAFFAGKHEITQAQWQRLTGDNPSVHTAVSIHVDDSRAPQHPVESIDWWTAQRVLRCAGLRLPSEAQWEYAARAGTTTPWYCAETIEQVANNTAGNLADATSAAALGAQGWAATPGLVDGYVMHAPIGSFAPNAFGLHDMLGNVAEWCLDEYVSYARPAAAGTGARPLTANPHTVMYRGGAFDEPAQEARSANRAGAPPDRRHFSLGVRAVRPLDEPR